MNEMTKIDTKALLTDATQFIWAESALLDDKDYDAWLALWTNDGHYIMPIGDGDDYANQLNLCYDDDKMRRHRIGRFQAGFSISSAPPAQTVRTLSRFTLEEADGETVKIRCAEHMIEDKFGRQRVFAANVTYTLVITEDGFKIRDKVIKLLNSDGMLTSISYLF